MPTEHALRGEPILARSGDAARLGGFADTTRVGGGNPELGTLMARGNRAAVRAALARYREELAELEALVEEEDWLGLRRSLEECARLRPQFLGGE